ncbi:hypothetical protein [Pelagibacterium sediminicola]|uniref:hypothetical protein n=1 Tax=Pelagibacterium sediminicola TaxID=2248761 RepID=UPI000E3202EE|nr:hypothetical protein [Pelagibacterium sediminicola]
MAGDLPSRETVAALAVANDMLLPEPYSGELEEAYGHVNAMLTRFRRCQTASGEMEQVFVPMPVVKEVDP